MLTEGRVLGPFSGRLSAPSSPSPESQGRWQHQLQSRRGIRAGTRGSFPVFHPNSECELKGHGSPPSPHRPPSNAQAGLSGCAPGLTLTSSSGVSGDRLTRRTGDLWVLEQWPQSPLRSGLGLSRGRLSLVKVLTSVLCVPQGALVACLPNCMPACGP